jgi:hypothetical protein
MSHFFTGHVYCHGPNGHDGAQHTVKTEQNFLMSRTFIPQTPPLESLPELRNHHFGIDYRSGPTVRDPFTGKYRRTRLFVLTLSHSRKPLAC